MAAPGQAPAVLSPPNNTVYVKNLAERISPTHLVETLRELFGDYGTIIDVVAKQSLKRKGQAFIVFDNQQAASQAIEDIQGFEVFGKPMVLDFARTKSDVVVEKEGGAQELEAHKRHRLAEKDRKQAQEAQALAQRKRPAPAVAEPAQPGKVAKPARGAGLKSTGGAAAVIPDEYLPPNKILFVRDVPEDYSVEALTAIFSRFEGFREVRTVPGRKGIAFVEYEQEQGAISAKEGTAGMVLGDEGKTIRVTYQRQ